MGLAGNRIQVVEHTGRIVQYDYDATYKLLEERIDDPEFGLRTLKYEYDKVGNRLVKIDNADTTVYAYDENDRLLTENSISYSYDDNGNTLLKVDGMDSTQYFYDFQNRLRKVDDGVDVIEYAYDTDGMRVQKSVNGNVTKFLLDKNRDYAQVLVESDGIGNELVQYVYGDDLISQNRSSLKTFYHYDGQLSTRQLSDANSQVTDTYTYDAFGLLLNRSGATENNYLYTGEQYDANVGFYYLRARYYNASIGRFLTQDTWPGMQFEPGSLHKYLYCEGGPVGRWDPSGMMTILELIVTTAIIGALIAGVIVLYHHIFNKLQASVIWEGTLEIIYIGCRAGVAVMYGNLKGEQKLENKILHGEGRYTIYMEGAGAYIPTYTKAKYKFYTPSVYGPNPVTLTGAVGYANISTFNPFWSLLGLTQHSPLEGEYLVGMYMGKGWSFGAGIYEGWDFGLDLKTGVSSLNYGKGPN